MKYSGGIKGEPNMPRLEENGVCQQQAGLPYIRANGSSQDRKQPKEKELGPSERKKRPGKPKRRINKIVFFFQLKFSNDA